MPEIPEVRAHAERLNALVASSQLERFELLSFSVLKNATPAVDAAKGETLRSVGQRGKYLILSFESQCQAIHLMQGGRLSPDAKRSKRPRGGLARWIFDNDETLLLTEPGKEHRAGIWTYEPGETPEIFATLGPDADTVSADELATILRSNSKRLHTFLRSQQAIAGIGRRLANEICHRAKLSPFASTAKLNDEAIETLSAAIKYCIHESLAFERSRDKMSSSKERISNAHKRTGEQCPNCDEQIREVAYQRYTVNYCPTCQTGGNILADNTTSKLLIQLK